MLLYDNSLMPVFVLTHDIHKKTLMDACWAQPLPSGVWHVPLRQTLPMVIAITAITHQHLIRSVVTFPPITYSARNVFVWRLFVSLSCTLFGWCLRANVLISAHLSLPQPGRLLSSTNTGLIRHLLLFGLFRPNSLSASRS